MSKFAAASKRSMETIVSILPEDNTNGNKKVKTSLSGSSVASSSSSNDGKLINCPESEMCRLVDLFKPKDVTKPDEKTFIAESIQVSTGKTHYYVHSGTGATPHPDKKFKGFMIFAQNRITPSGLKKWEKSADFGENFVLNIVATEEELSLLNNEFADWHFEYFVEHSGDFFKSAVSKNWSNAEKVKESLDNGFVTFLTEDDVPDKKHPGQFYPVAMKLKPELAKVKVGDSELLYPILEIIDSTTGKQLYNFPATPFPNPKATAKQQETVQKKYQQEVDAVLKVYPSPDDVANLIPWNSKVDVVYSLLGILSKEKKSVGQVVRLKRIYRLEEPTVWTGNKVDPLELQKRFNPDYFVNRASSSGTVTRKNENDDAPEESTIPNKEVKQKEESDDEEEEEENDDEEEES